MIYIFSLFQVKIPKRKGENMNTLKKNIQKYLGGIIIGLVNGFFGAGGGIIAVPLLEKSGLQKKEAHANAVAVILPISILSGVLYIVKDYVNLKSALPYIPTGLIGALLGTVILRKISTDILKKIFGAFMVYAGVRLLLR